MSKFVKNTSLIFATQVVSLVFSLAYAVITARILGPEGKGILSLVILVPNLIVLASNLGVEISNTYFVSGKKYKTQDIIDNALFLALGIGLFLVVIIWIFTPFISEVFLKGISVSLLRISVFIIPLGLLQRYLTAILLGQQRIPQLSIVKIGGSVASLLLTILLLVVFNLGVVGPTVAIVLSAVISVIIALYFIRQQNFRLFPAFNRNIFFHTIRHGLKGYAGNLLQFFNYRFDVFIVNYFLGVASVGYYMIAVSLGEFVWYIPNSIASVLFPKTASSKKEEANQFTPLVFRHTLLITSAAALGLFAISRFLIPFVFGEKFVPSILPLWILLPGIVCLSLSKILTGDLNGRGLPQYGSYSAGISLIFTLLLDFLLIPKLGIAGAALASTVSYLISTLIVIFFFLKVSGLQLQHLFLFNSREFIIYRDYWQKVIRMITQIRLKPSNLSVVENKK